MKQALAVVWLGGLALLAGFGFIFASTGGSDVPSPAFPTVLDALQPEGFSAAGKVQLYGTAEQPGPDGTIFHFIDGGGVAYEKHDFRRVRHAEFHDGAGHTVRFDLYVFAGPAQATAALGDEAICPPGNQPWTVGPEGRIVHFVPDYYVYFVSGPRLVFLHLDDDRQAAVLDRFALAVQALLTKEER